MVTIQINHTSLVDYTCTYCLYYFELHLVGGNIIGSKVYGKYSNDVIFGHFNVYEANAFLLEKPLNKRELMHRKS